MNTALLKELIDLSDAFEQHFPNKDDQHLAMFSTWLSQRIDSVTSRMPVTEVDAYGDGYLPPLPKLPTYIVHFLCMDYRYHKQQVKKALYGTPLITYDDFIYLTLLAMNGSMTKMSLVETTVNEKASGMLVIKRLMENEFVIQTNDLHDHRSRRISITQKGRDILTEIIPAMGQANRLFVGNLSEGEQKQLADLLTKLDEFHKPLFLHDKNTSLGQLYEKLIGTE